MRIKTLFGLVTIFTFLISINSCGNTSSHSSERKNPPSEKPSETFPPSGFLKVLEKYCNDKEIEILPGEFIYFNSDKAIIGLSSVHENDCRVADFYSLVVSTFDSETKIITQPVSSVGAKNSCVKERLKGRDIFFSEFTLYKNMAAILATKECPNIRMKLEILNL